MAGLGSACSHIAALLFKLETAVLLKLKDSTALYPIYGNPVRKQRGTSTTESCKFFKCKKVRSVR